MLQGEGRPGRPGRPESNTVIFHSNPPELRHFEAVEAAADHLKSCQVGQSLGQSVFSISKSHGFPIRLPAKNVPLEAVRPYLAERCVVVLHDVEFSFLRNSVWSIKKAMKKYENLERCGSPRMVIQVLAFFFQTF